eukprot:1118304-Prymnesium_polylepis.1
MPQLHVDIRGDTDIRLTGSTRAIKDDYLKGKGWQYIALPPKQWVWGRHKGTSGGKQAVTRLIGLLLEQREFTMTISMQDTETTDECVTPEHVSRKAEVDP